MIDEAPAAGSEQSRRGRPLVLVVDDDPHIRVLCADTLRVDGFDVIEAANGQEGLELAEAERPDLLLLDVSMPVLDGFALASALRRDERTRQLPLVFLTGEPEPDVEAHAFAVGALGFFRKPFDPAVVSAFVSGVLARRKLTS